MLYWLVIWWYDHVAQSMQYTISVFIKSVRMYKYKTIPEIVSWKAFLKKSFLKKSQNSQENTCVGDLFYFSCKAQTCTFIKKKTPRQVFSCEFCEILKQSFIHRTPTEHFFDFNFSYRNARIKYYYKITKTIS